MLDLDDEPVGGLHAARDDHAARRGPHRRPERRLDVDAAVPAAPTLAEGRDDRAIDGPREGHDRAVEVGHREDEPGRRSRPRDRRGPEHGALAERARPHDSNSAYRMPNSSNRPDGGSQRTFTFSTSERGGPLPSSRMNSSMTGRGPSARARTRPSLRFMTKPASPRLEPRRCA